MSRPKEKAHHGHRRRHKQIVSQSAQGGPCQDLFIRYHLNSHQELNAVYFADVFLKMNKNVRILKTLEW